MKGLVILTSTGFRNPSVSQAIREHFEKLPQSGVPRVVIIPTAAEEKGNNPFVLRQKNFIEEQLSAVVDVIDIEEQDIDTSRFDIVFIVGGNTFHLINCARTRGLTETLNSILAKGGVIVGASAGALVLGPDIRIAAEVTPDDMCENTGDYSGLGIVDRIIYPHYEAAVEDELRAFEIRHNVSVERLDNNGFISLTPSRTQEDHK